MKNTHILHIDELPLEGRCKEAYVILNDLVTNLSIGNSKDIDISVKFDGAPAIVFGVHPENGKLFCGTKAVFNKKPKIAYSEDDIVELYGSNAGLAEKLRLFFHYFEKDYSRGYIPDGVYQGDFMYSAEDVLDEGDDFSFTQNTITYTITKNSKIGSDIFYAILGVAIHTKYEGDTLEDMQVCINDDIFYSNAIHWISTKLDTIEYPLSMVDQGESMVYLSCVKVIMDEIDACDIVKQHSKMIRMFINMCIKIGETAPDSRMYETFLKNRNEDELIKTYMHKNISNALLASKCISQCKLVFYDLFNTKSPFKHTINGEDTEPEGYVINYNNELFKIVNRTDFSKKNFMNRKFNNA